MNDFADATLQMARKTIDTWANVRFNRIEGLEIVLHRDGTVQRLYWNDKLVYIRSIAECDYVERFRYGRWYDQLALSVDEYYSDVAEWIAQLLGNPELPVDKPGEGC